MDRVKPPRFVRKAGAQIPEHVLEAMERRHPNVRILWDWRANLWCLVQSVRGKEVLIRYCGSQKRPEAPTLANTVYVLDRSHPSNFASAKEREKLLAGVDANPGLVAAQKRSQVAIADGSRDMFNALNRRVVRTVRP